MGFTQEHPLHFSTRRLWAWRDEWGAESYWQERSAGRSVPRAARASGPFWPIGKTRRRCLNGRRGAEITLHDVVQQRDDVFLSPGDFIEDAGYGDCQGAVAPVDAVR